MNVFIIKSINQVGSSEYPINYVNDQGVTQSIGKWSLGSPAAPQWGPVHIIK